MHSQIADQNLAVHARHFACLHSGSARAAAGNPVLRITCSSQSAWQPVCRRLNHSQSDNETFDRARGKKQLGSCFRKPSINRRSALHAEQCAACNAIFRPHNTRPPTTLHSPTGGVWDRKPVVGRGPRDQSSGQKPRARAPEALPHPAPLRFERARGAKLRHNAATM